MEDNLSRATVGMISVDTDSLVGIDKVVASKGYDSELEIISRRNEISSLGKHYGDLQSGFKQILNG